MGAIWLIIGGIVFCVFSYYDFAGSDERVNVKYQKLPGREKWQRKRAILEAIIGIGAFLYCFLHLFESLKFISVIIALIVVIAFICAIVNDRSYTKQSQLYQKK